ncbi:MAG: type III pantothenate kinase [Prevotella sp.]|nr:type III pantothenate kinase [Bacteroides sp.]MCM1366007.1 type III pantothenate kinase [Prevotella sp.]MCM1436923.1 type III pantothenate kinase [Prevotella sp.]
MNGVITIDQGNTRVKTTLMIDGKMVEEHITESAIPDVVLGIIDRHDVEGAIYSSVAGMDVRYIESIRHLLDGRVEVFTHTSPLPIKIAYKTPHTLGLDRIAAACGAAHLHKGESLLVVDAGTCVTLDVLSADATFIGGNITPGVLMRFKSLHNFTGALPLVASKGDTPSFGYDTATAIRSGVINGVLAEIDSTLARAKQLYNITGMVLSGGDISTLEQNVKTICKNRGIKLHDEPHLIPAGLEQIFRY